MALTSALAAICCGIATGGDQSAPAAGLLVAMRNSNRIEGYDCATGKWLGTFAFGVSNPAGLAWGPDGNLYVSSGAIQGLGSVKRYDGTTGACLGDFIAYPPGTNGQLLRGTGLVFHDGHLYVAGCDNGKIIQYHAQTGQWVRDFAGVKPVSVTQIRVRDGALLAADFQSQSILRFDVATGAAQSNLTALPGFSPWGLAFDQRGQVFWSGSTGTIQRFDGTQNTTWAGSDGSLKIPLWLEIGPDGNLYCSNHGGNSVDVFAGQGDKAGQRVLRIAGTEVQGPVGLAFTDRPMPVRHLVRIGDMADSAAKRSSPTEPAAADALPQGVIRLEAVQDLPVVTELGWDTEGGDRAKHNLLRAPLELTLKMGDTVRRAEEFPCAGEALAGKLVRYRIRVSADVELVWELQAERGRLALRFASPGKTADRQTALRLTFPFNPRLAATTVISAEHAQDGGLRLPAIVSAPDLGQMLLTCPAHPDLVGRLDGHRGEQWVNLSLDLPWPDESGYTLELAPWVLPRPQDLKDTSRWPLARRGWFNFLQVNAQPRGTGVWANNVISNPVSSTVFWLGDQIQLIPELAPGVPAAPLLRRSLEYWMYDAIQPDARIHYTEDGPGSVMMDANPAVLIGAWSYVQVSGDEAWLARHIERLEFISRYVEQRDVDGDGLIESPQTGNRGTHAFGDTAWDTYSSGHKNAYVNALAYRAFRGLADLQRRLKRDDQGKHYAALADRLKSAFADAFYNPETGWLGWWRSQDGVLHDIYSDVPTSLAIMYGLVSPQRGRPMLDAFWREVEKTGFQRFDLGLPLNLRPVHRDDQFGNIGGSKEDGSETFQKYLNGGCCVSNTYFFLVANYLAGDTERADKILDAMLQRQHAGVFPNGGGFQNGVINRLPEGAEFFDWSGNTCGYEGHLVYSWMFLQAVLLREPQFRERLFGVLGR